MANHIRCAGCRFARPDRNAITRKWTAYECGNPESGYHRCLLNVTITGDKQERITWSGCPHGERRDG